jgi:DNA ligase D-like protein (predicted 3'-phosphoesterase)
MSKLQNYREKRKSDSTPEPMSEGEAENGKEPIFVIQEHNASTRHWDFRLQVDDVLKSWAVPKGPSTDPREKRLAVRTEDHPLDYADFEGNIPEDNYGAGSVIVWDRGSYQHRTEKDGEKLSFDEADKKGHISITLHGEKLQGGYELIKMKGERWDDDQWLLKKTDDEEADARRRPTSTQPESVITGRTVEEVSEEDE